MMNKPWMLIVLLAGGLAAGCGIKPPIGGRAEPYVAKQVQYASKDLRNHTTVGVPVASREPSGQLTVSVPVRAATNLQLYVDHRFIFLDAHGHELSRTAWQTTTLTPNVFDRVTATSYSPLAADFQLQLRYAQ